MTTESEIERRNFENKLTDLVAYLPEGRNNPVKAHELAEHIGSRQAHAKRICVVSD